MKKRISNLDTEICPKGLSWGEPHEYITEEEWCDGKYIHSRLICNLCGKQIIWKR